ncbi:MAG: carbonic anhydrase [Catenulisporales bacterium]|nr:carbonic anhydrase [Catenulisporales bacterium]
MTSRMSPLLERNAQFADTFTPVPFALPTALVIVITCVDHRVDPAITLGLGLGEAPVLRNAGGRVSRATIEEIAYLSFLGRRLAGGKIPDDLGVEVAVIHHTQCGTGFLDDPDFRREASEVTGVDEEALGATAVGDPYATVAVDVQRLLDSPLLPPRLGISGHVYDVETGRVTTVCAKRLVGAAARAV